MPTQISVKTRRPMSNFRRRNRLGNIPYYIILAIWAIITIVVFVWVIESSFKTNREVFKDPWNLPAAPWTSATRELHKSLGSFPHATIFL